MKKMVFDPDCYVVGTFSGAMTIAKMGPIISRMIDHGMLQAIVATGALVAHGFSEAIGCTHYKVESHTSDFELFAKGYNRVYDTLELEANLNEVDLVMTATLERIPPDAVLSSEVLTRELGRTLAMGTSGPGILKSAFLKEVPVYIPALMDSELGLDLSAWIIGKKYAPRKGAGSKPCADRMLNECLSVVPQFNPFLDLGSYSRNVMKAKKLAIFTIGGGVPRNWAQQVGPYFDIINWRLGTQFKPPIFKYGVRICPDPDYWGGLSGCTYSEGISWGKFLPPEKGGQFAEVLCDATLVWPLLVKGLLEIVRSRKNPKKEPAKATRRRAIR